MGGILGMLLAGMMISASVMSAPVSYSVPYRKAPLTPKQKRARRRAWLAKKSRQRNYRTQKQKRR